MNFPLYKRLILLFATLLLQTGWMFAEIIVGRVVDWETNAPLASATIIHVVKNGAANSSSTSYNTEEVDSLGRFTLYGSSGMHSLVFNLIGYKEVSRRMVCSGNNNDTIRLGDIKLKVSDVLLKGADIKARRKLFYMRGDTVIYDPKMFHLKKGDRIERLLKKLSGVTVEQDGQLLWLGKPIVMILNGEENPVATSFLPQLAAEAVEKVKVYDKKSDYDRKHNRSGQKVLDIKIKKEWMEKWYGNAAVRLEEGEHYNVNANGFHLSDYFPTSVYANMGDGGHVYSPGFGREGGKLKKENTREVRQHVIGLNSEYRRFPNERDYHKYKSSSLSFSPSLEHFDAIQKSFYSSEKYLNDNSATYYASNNDNYQHRLSVSPMILNGNFVNKWLGLSFSLNIDYEKEETSNSSNYLGLNALPYHLVATPLDHINDSDSLGAALRAIASYSGRNQFATESDRISISPVMSVRFNLNKRSDLSANLYFDYTGRKARRYSLSNTRYYTNSALLDIDKSYYSNPSHSTNANLSAFYDYDLANFPNSTGRNNHSVSLKTGYNLRLTNDVSDYKYYRWLTNDFEGDSMMLSLHYLPQNIAVRDSALDKNNSVRSNTHTIVQTLSFALVWRYRKFDANVNVSAKSSSERLSYLSGRLDTLAKRNTTYTTFKMNLEYSVKNNTKLRLKASTDVSLPRISDMLKYIDDRSQTNIVFGNPALRRMRSESVSLDFNTVVTKWQLMMNGSLTYRRNHNNQTVYSIYDAISGITVNTPKNIRGGHTWALSYSAEILLASKWRLKNSLRANMTKSYRYLTEHISHSSEPSEAAALSMQGGNIVINAQKGRMLDDEFQLFYSGVDIDATFYAQAANRYWTNSNGANSSYNYWDYTVGLRGKYRFWSNLELQFDGCFTGKDGYMTSFLNKNRVLVDASLSLYVFKSEGKVTLGMDDIFNKNTNNSFSVAPSSRSESRTTSIHHYYYVSFTYNFDGSKQKGRSRNTALTSSYKR